MSTITVLLKPSPDGSLHLPLPPEFRTTAMVKVVATLETVTEDGIGIASPSKQDYPHDENAPGPRPQFGCLAGKISLTADFDEPLDDFKEYME
jgi:hypothetical protein